MTKSEELVRILIDNNWHLGTAESLTGGMLSSEIVSVPGASGTFVEGFVTYSIEAKEKTLMVPADTIASYGAVSEETAAQMAIGALTKAGAQVSMATTGNAGPDPSEDKPVGLVYTAVDVLGKVSVTEHYFIGSRSEIRKQTVDACIDECLQLIKERL